MYAIPLEQVIKSSDFQQNAYAMNETMIVCGGLSTFDDGGGGFFKFLTNPSPVPAVDGVNVFAGDLAYLPNCRFIRMKPFATGFSPTVVNAVNRALNSAFTVSITKAAAVYYSLKCTVTNPLLAGSSTANAFLEFSTNGGTTWTLAGQIGNESTVGLAVSIQLTNGQTSVISGAIPAGAQVRIRTTTTGTATVTYVANSGSEIIFN